MTSLRRAVHSIIIPKKLEDQTARFLDGMKADLEALYEQGFHDGVAAERQRMAGLIAGGAMAGEAPQVKSTRSYGRRGKAAKKTGASGGSYNNGGTVSNAAVPAPKKKRKNPWTSLTEEQKAERLKGLAAGRAKRLANLRGTGDTGTQAGAAPTEATSGEPAGTGALPEAVASS